MDEEFQFFKTHKFPKGYQPFFTDNLEDVGRKLATQLAASSSEVALSNIQMLVDVLPGDRGFNKTIAVLRSQESTAREDILKEIGLENEIDRLQKVVLEYAETVGRHNAVLAERAWWISSFLFAIGWSLGLLGKLYGVPEAAGGE